jgi:hypothetical protein
VDEESKVQRLEEVLIELLFDGYKIELINDLISMLNLNQNDKENQTVGSTTIKKLIKQCLNKISSILIEEKKKPESKTNCMTKLNTLLDTISTYLNSAKKEDKLLNDEDVMQCMRTFCNDQQVEISIRLFILEELKRILKSMNDNDLMLLLVYKTNAILLNSKYFDGKIDGPIEADIIENEQKRTEYLLKLIDFSETKSDYLALLNLIKVWPKFSNKGASSDNLLNMILIKLILNEAQFVDILEEFKQNNPTLEYIRVDDLNYIRDEVLAAHESTFLAKISLLKLCLAFKVKENENFTKKFMRNDEEFRNLIESSEQFEDDTELIAQLEKDNFYLEIINTNFFAYFTNFLIKNEEDKTKLFKIAKKLKSNGFEMEAAKFVCEIENFYTAYQSLSCSLALLEKTHL